MEGKIILVNIKFYCTFSSSIPSYDQNLAMQGQNQVLSLIPHRNLFQLNPAGELGPSNCPKLLALSACLYLHVIFYPGVVNFCRYIFPQALAKFKYTERNHPKEYLGDPCFLRQLLIIRIRLDFYEDYMSPWVLSSIHIQWFNPTHLQFYTVSPAALCYLLQQHM